MQPGQRIRDYVFEEKIGEGGMGEVWRAEHGILQRPVAIKVMARHLEADHEFGQRFLQEARAQARLSHPRIVGVSDFFAEAGQYFLVMPLMSGKTLADRLHEVQGPLPVGEALAIARDVLDALDYAHQQGVIHRDVKPSNVLLDIGGHACLTDFGIALSLGRSRLTRTGASLGTPHYMSPEQIRAPRTLDHRTDVYSFACVLYEMLAGRPPFAEAADAEDTDFALKEAHVYRMPEPLQRWNPQVPAWLNAAVQRALAKKPDERFSGCGEFRRALDAPPPPPPPPKPGVVVNKPGSVNRDVGTTVVIALTIAAVLAFILFLIIHNMRHEQADVEESTTAMEPATGVPMGTDMGTDMGTGPMGTDLETTEPMATDMGTTEPSAPPPSAETLPELGGELDQRAQTTGQIPLEAGYTYKLDGSCDNDCSDLDLYLWPPGATEAAAEDASDSDFPSLTYTPTESGDFSLVVRMWSCSRNPCRYTVKVTRTAAGGP